MTCLRTIGLLLLTGAALFGQFLTGLTQNVSRVVTVTPDEAVFNISVNTTSETTLEILLGILKKVEITAKDLVGQGVGLSYYPSDLQNHYEFRFIVSPSRMQEVAKSLNVLQVNLPDGVTAVQFTAYLNASDKSVEEARVRVLPDLLADARRRADVLARLSGFNIGAIESIVDNVYPSYNYGFSNSQGFAYTFNLTTAFGRK